MNTSIDAIARSFGLMALGAGVGVALTVLWFQAPSVLRVLPPLKTATVPSFVNATTTDALPKDASGAVSVSDQRAGGSVTVSAVTVPPPGVWVAVHEYDGTERGNALGALRIRGPVERVTVPLLRDTVPGHTYAVVLYRDNGDDVFNLADDSVYVDFDTGEPVVAPFATNE